MSTQAVVPGPRSSLDEGTIHDLCVDGAQVALPSSGAHTGGHRSASAPVAVDVPDDARHLLDELPAYGT